MTNQQQSEEEFDSNRIHEDMKRLVEDIKTLKSVELLLETVDKLEAENERYRKALEKIEEGMTQELDFIEGVEFLTKEEMRAIAREALKES